MRRRPPLIWASGVPAVRSEDPQNLRRFRARHQRGGARSVARVRNRAPLAFGTRAEPLCFASVWLLWGTASSDLHAELLHPGV